MEVCRSLLVVYMLGATVIDKYAKLFAIVLPITSILLIPQIQGTTPGLMMALFSPFLVLTAREGQRRIYWQGIIIFVAVFIFFVCASQLSLYLDDYPSMANLVLIRPGPLGPLRVTVFTQGLYLVSAFLTFILFTTYYNEEWDRFIIIGGVLLATIGLAEWVYFLATGGDFSFISNRKFDEDLEGSGSLVQIMTVMGHALLRLKGLTGEPSMYALTMFPYVVFCIVRRRFLVGAYICVTLLLSTSTTALLGFVVFGLLMVIFYTKGIVLKIINLLFLVLLIGVFAFLFKDLIIPIVVEKLMLENVSGVDRFFNFSTHLGFWLKSGPLIKMFGIGWGTIRSTDMISTLLVNSGIFGLLLWMFLFLKPSVSVRRNEPAAFILNLGLITVLIMLFVAVSEYSYLTTWMFLGILYNMILAGSRVSAGDTMQGNLYAC